MNEKKKAARVLGKSGAETTNVRHKEKLPAWGRKGGLTNKKKGKAYFSEISKLGHKARWGKL